LEDTDANGINELFQSADDKLFKEIVHNPAHVLQPLIPDRPPSSYDLRPRTHDKLLLNKTSYLNDREFVIRVLYSIDVINVQIKIKNVKKRKKRGKNKKTFVNV